MKYEKTTEPFYHTGAWEHVRQLALNRDHGYCRKCVERFEAGLIQKPNRATMVHHIIPYKERPDLACDLDNLVSLCYACHEQVTPERHKPKDKNVNGMRVIKI